MGKILPKINPIIIPINDNSDKQVNISDKQVNISDNVLKTITKIISVRGNHAIKSGRNGANGSSHALTILNVR